jgi:hypothetical protein
MNFASYYDDMKSNSTNDTLGLIQPFQAWGRPVERVPV